MADLHTLLTKGLNTIQLVTIDESHDPRASPGDRVLFCYARKAKHGDVVVAEIDGKIILKVVDEPRLRLVTKCRCGDGQILGVVVWVLVGF